ncbi:MAG TPA: D-alanyl-D-alanine carboxypeptidase/D-alanyl-D-alanine-endopeptidase [Flavisolibacter sp.]|nr:D-alanyl-D-alanine carboxypeptidase/D-alanyl-D-alanine-endopeptidase [Flavisolibacter sp.]
MKKLFFLFLLVVSVNCLAQTVSSRLSESFENFERDAQLQNAISSLYVVDAKTGKVVFDKNSTIGLATASTLKVVTAATAYELLGKEFRYQTKFGYVGKRAGSVLKGDFYIQPSGDPTLGSWRWKATADMAVMNDLLAVIKKMNISAYNRIVIDNRAWNDEAIPDGWIWQDIGNYYGAGAAGFNWRENQFDIVLKSGKNLGDPVGIVRTKPSYQSITLASFATSAAKGSGDNAYVYYPLTNATGVVRGTIPVNESAFEISAASPDPAKVFTGWFENSLRTRAGIRAVKSQSYRADTTVMFTHASPPLDSIVYWFLKKSINLYGEALVKTFAYQKEGRGSTDKGVDLVKDFWKERGIPHTELNIVDGSGLSPLNRVTTRAQVSVLQYAKTQSWFSGFYHALPEYNGMKIKSGTIRGVKGFCGYHTAKDGNEYIFSFLVNNYNGSASALVRKMYAVLDVLK